MTDSLSFTGFIKGVAYQTFLDNPLEEVDFDNFDVNQAENYGLIKLKLPKTEVAYSKWVSPKRTRSYPFARIYNTYNSCKVLTIIPIIKDEGKNGDRDVINYITFSWMNLLNVYIVLAYYESAEKSNKKGQEKKDKLTNQQFDNEFVKKQIQEISTYRQSALHWNKNLFEEKFTEIFATALNCYDVISQKTGVLIHSRKRLEQYLNKITKDFAEFKNLSLKSSYKARGREIVTQHKLEFLNDGAKAQFNIENYLGGVYYLTTDGVILEDNRYIIQESKNATDKPLPSLVDIQDGLFKLILFSNLDSLLFAGKAVSFISKLKLTGKNIVGVITLPEQNEKLDSFIQANDFNKNQIEIINKLVLEATNNQNLKIEISSNSLKKKISSSDQSSIVKSPLRYPGGKSKAITQIMNYLPENFSEYREPFVGGGSLFIHLKQKYPHLKIWINDLNTELFLFWKIAQSHLNKLVQEIFNVKAKYQDGRKLFKDLTEVEVQQLSDLERAIRFFVLNRITFSGTVDSGGFSLQAFNKRFTISSIERLEKLEYILSDIKITNLDYSHLLTPQDKNIFLFLDPPYFSATKSKLYGTRGDLHTCFDHQRFSNLIKQCSNSWLITYDDCVEIRNNFQCSNIYEWEIQYGMNNYKQPKAAKGRELFINNYELKSGFKKDASETAIQLSLL